MSETVLITQDKLLALAIIAASAAGIPVGDVKLTTSIDDDETLPAVMIGDTTMWLCQDERGYYWAVGCACEVYDHLREALTEAVSNEALRRADDALQDAGLGGEEF